MVKTKISELPKVEPADIQRWEDEGGQMNETSRQTPGHPSSQPLPAGRNDRSMQWNERFVIEPSEPSHGVFVIQKVQPQHDRLERKRP